ncbi:ImmA/IrrE family metallo-endopeptidase [uncultured Microbacterium sp.]|uniref:ImmA/IrrE family metallo-endopeptidase n=1 Tax=uncultured Microbacterium sp. TaxID=191216 RepID=UPI0028E558DF|nr:ImmA/IrrE family metallo-endopeptidase [uncultured Microbacterium sp.]
MNKAALGRLANEVRTDFGLADDQPFDPFRWSSENGIPFISLREFTADEAAMRHFLEERPHVWSAALLHDGRRHFVIYNPERSPERTRSDLTHEVAHFEAEHDPSPAWTDEGGGCGGTTKAMEREAAELAGAILVPLEGARRSAIRGLAPQSVARRYQVSVEMAEWRMRMSGGYEIRRRARAKR